MGDRRRRHLAPTLERMEGRELPSGLMAVLGSSRPHPSFGALALAASNPAGANGFTPGNPSPLLGQGTPTPQELARERFVAAFQGPLTSGPGRFSDQSKIIYMRGVGGSNNFLHGDFQMAIVFPKDPNAPLTGEAYLEDKNNNSSGQLGLILTGSRANVDRFGRPTKMTFTNDPNIYSGIYFTDAATGTVTIHYGRGTAQAVFQGRVYTSGLTSPIKNADLVGRGGRINP